MKTGLAITFVLALAVLVSPARSQESATGGDASIGSEELAVYEAVLQSWLGDHNGRQLVDLRLGAAPLLSDSEIADCVKGLSFTPPVRAGGGEKSLAAVRFSRPGIELIDGEAWRPSDPGAAIARGKSVEAAVDEGFANSLIRFSRITFSQDGQDALVDFQMVCGRLCGNGSTLLLHKDPGGWAYRKQCGGWIS